MDKKNPLDYNYNANIEEDTEVLATPEGVFEATEVDATVTPEPQDPWYKRWETWAVVVAAAILSGGIAFGVTNSNAKKAENIETTQIVQLEEALESEQETVAELQSQLDKVNKDKKGLEDDKEHLQEDVKKATDEDTELGKKVEKLTKELDETKADLTKTTDDLNSNKAALKEATKRGDEWKSTAESLMDELVAAGVHPDTELPNQN